MNPRAILQRLSYGLLWSALFAVCPWAAANEQADMARLAQILALSDHDNNEGIRQLNAFRRQLAARGAAASTEEKSTNAITSKDAKEYSEQVPNAKSTIARSSRDQNYASASASASASVSTNLGSAQNSGASAAQSGYDEAAPTDSVLLEALDILVQLYADAGDKVASKAALQEMLQLATTSKNKEAVAVAQIMMSVAARDKEKPAVIIDQLKNIEQRYGAGMPVTVRFRLDSALAWDYSNIAKFEQSLHYYLDALSLVDQLPRRRIHARAKTLNTLAQLYWRMKDRDQALKRIGEALSIAQTADAPKVLAFIFEAQAILLGETNHLDESLVAYKKALKIAQESKLTNVETRVLISISDHYLRVHDFARAEVFSKRGMLAAQKVDNPELLVIAKSNYGGALAGLGKTLQGAAYINEALTYFEKNGFKHYLDALFEELTAVYERAGMYKEAAATLRRKRINAEELYRADRAKAIAAVQETFDAEQRQKKIDLLARENALKDADLKNERLQQIITLLGALLSVLAGLFSYALYRRAKKISARLQGVHAQLEFFAGHDPLTGLHNRRSFIDMMNSRAARVQNVERRGQEAGHSDCLIMLDIDHFKAINDQWGHSVGDSVLVEVASKLKNVVRGSDMVLRWGGEEFLIYTPKSTPPEIAHLVSRVLEAVGHQPLAIGRLRIPVTISAGFVSLPVAALPDSLGNWETSLQLADMALYRAKQQGRNRAYGIGALLMPAEQALPVLTKDLAAALSAGMLELIEVIGPITDNAPVDPDIMQTR